MTAPGETAPKAAPYLTTATSSGETTYTGADAHLRNADGTFRAPTTKEFRYPADYHVTWMRGKTADEVGGLSDQMYAELVRRAPTPAAPAAVPNNGTATTMPNQDLWLTDPNAAAAQMLAHARATEFAPAFSNMANQLGAAMREGVKRDCADEFRKYGPEIDLYINQMDPQYRSLDNIVKVVGMVRANHIDEIVAERSQAKLNEMLN